MNYWLDLFTGTTWEEFQKAGANVSGFRQHNWKRAEKIKPADVFLCYLVGVKRWVGLLEVTGDRYKDETRLAFESVLKLIAEVQHPAQLRFHQVMKGSPTPPPSNEAIKP